MKASLIREIQKENFVFCFRVLAYGWNGHIDQPIAVSLCFFKNMQNQIHLQSMCWLKVGIQDTTICSARMMQPVG